MSKHLKTPCIGLCSTVYGDTVCLGCKRFDYEVINWNGYNEQQQNLVWQRLDTLLTQVMQPKLTITDPLLLKQKLIRHHIRFQPHQSTYSWAYQLLTKGARHIKDISAYGITLLPPHHENPLWQLQEQIDTEYFALSLTHYQSTHPQK